MWVIHDEAGGTWAHFCGDNTCWSEDPGTATQYEEKAVAEAAAIAHGIDPAWVVEA